MADWWETDRDTFRARCRTQNWGRYGHVAISSMSFGDSEMSDRQWDKPRDPISQPPTYPRAPEAPRTRPARPCRMCRSWKRRTEDVGTCWRDGESWTTAESSCSQWAAKVTR